MKQLNEIFLCEIEGVNSFYGKIESIIPDIKRGWYIFTFTILNPQQTQTLSWILREEYIDGDMFTIDGKKFIFKYNRQDFESPSNNENKESQISDCEIIDIKPYLEKRKLNKTEKISDNNECQIIDFKEEYQKRRKLNGNEFNQPDTTA